MPTFPSEPPLSLALQEVHALKEKLKRSEHKRKIAEKRATKFRLAIERCLKEDCWPGDFVSRILKDALKRKS